MTNLDPAVQVDKVGYIGVQTPDLDRLLDYYTQVLDFAVVDCGSDYAFLTTGADHHCVLLQKSSNSESANGRTTVGYEISSDLSDALRRLTDRGINAELRTDIGPGVPAAVVVEEPGSATPLHLYASQHPSGVSGITELRPTKLGHIAAWTPDLVTLKTFYEDALGFRFSDMIGDFFVFLRCNRDHHAANFMANQKMRGLHHVAYEVRDLDHLQRLLDNLSKHGHMLHWGPGRHGPGHNVFSYHRDPDGNVVELFTQLDEYDDTAGCFVPRPWHEDVPQVPKTWDIDIAMAMNKWGPQPPDLDA